MRHVLLVCLFLTLLSIAVTAADQPPLVRNLSGTSQTSVHHSALPQALVFDTITTQCGIPLVVSWDGNMGHFFSGLGNMGFPQPSPECDTNGGTLNRGDASIYLGDASPVIVRKNGSEYTASWSIFQDGFADPHIFLPFEPSSPRGKFTASRWEGYNTGTFMTSDSLVKLERTYWAPTGATNADSCKFMIMRTRIFPANIGTSVSGLAIGDAFDFDVPSDSGVVFNVAGTDPTRSMVYVRGFNSLDTVTDCYNNSLRYAGAALIRMHQKDLISQTTLYAGYNAASDSFVYPDAGFIPEQLWANMQSTGYSNEIRVTDLHSLLVYKNVGANAGYTLQANDTLTIWTAIAVTRPAGGTTAQGLDSLKKEIDKAKAWYYKSGIIAPIICGYCIGTTGNVNCGPAQTPDLSDLSLLIQYLTAGPFSLPCPCEADINLSSLVDLTDLSILIAYLTTEPRPILPNCP